MNNDVSSYITNRMDNENFIDISILLPLLENSSYLDEEKINILNKVHIYNLSIIKKVMKENANLKENNLSIDNISIQNSVNNCQISNKDTIKTIHINVMGICQTLKNMTDTSQIHPYLQSVINPLLYIETINSLIAELLEEKITIKKLQNEEYLKTGQYPHNFDDDLTKIDILLKNLYRLKHESSDKENTQNNLIYLMTDCDNISITNDLKAIPTEYYDSFYRLLSSIRNGNFKNFKRIGTKSDTFRNALMEVKEHQTRVVFSQINANTYIILTLFIKKVNTSSDYKSNLRNADSLYSKMKMQILDDLSHNYTDYINYHNEITDHLFNKLLTKDKGGDINGYALSKNTETR